MINFSTLQGLTIPEGVVTQIADASGRVLWAVANDEPVILEVEKQTLTTYAGETSYADEQFILLDIYPKSANSTVDVTYGGLTKTLTFNGTNAQQVYFGTFNGVADSVETPASGTLTIEGGCNGFACGVYQSSSKTTNTSYAPCITTVSEWGNVTIVPNYAFYRCNKLALTELPSGITSIGEHAFNSCTGITLTELPSGITSIGDYTFANCFNLNISAIPEGVTNIGSNAFAMARTDKGVEQTVMKGGHIILPSTLQSVEDNVFALGTQGGFATKTSYISAITLLATTPPAVSGNFPAEDFYGQIIVPKGCAEAYKAADGWSAYADKIVEVS